MGPLPQVSLDSLAYTRTLLSILILLLPLTLHLPLLRKLRPLASRLLGDLVPLESVVSAEPRTAGQQRDERHRSIKVWRQAAMAGLAAVPMALWMATTGNQILMWVGGEASARTVILSAGMVLVWLYLFLLPLVRPPSTPPWPAVLVYLLLWTLSILTIALAYYGRAVSGHLPAWANSTRFALEAGNIAITTCLLVLAGGLPLASAKILSRLPSVATDDEVTLFSWLSFTWINPFINKGNSQELEPEDLPLLSTTQQTAIVFDRFRQLATSSLLRQIILANKLDLFLDASLTLVSVVFNYAGPFFLKQILDGLTDRSPEAMSQAYIYAFLALLASVLKAVTDLLHLWHGRRSTLRIKAELTAAIYDKALRRKDASGVVSAKEGAEDKEGGAVKKSNADSGKVVNLMSGDTNRIGNTVAGAYYLYGSPIEIIVASVFLYKIMGWSAFAGVVVLIVAVPANSFVSKRSVQITQDLLKARDKRISVMNELIGAIQFIKFFAWIEQWKGRAIDARKKEMSQLVRSLVNGIWFALLWSTAPILVTLVSFYCYIVIAQRDLTVSVAFTAISLFTMVRMPLNVIPTFIVIALQAHVSVKRIEDFLNEDEVPDWVCSLKRSAEEPTGPTKIGFERATLQWNNGEQTGDDKVKAGETSSKPPASPVTSNGSAATAVNGDGDAASTASNAEEPFRLSELNVTFPLHKLTIVTGPTGSGKTAILTGLLGEMDLLEGRSYLPKDVMQVDKATGLRNSVAYAAQTPWLQQRSIKDNILFGEEYVEERYESVLEACALLPDLDALEDGDQTEIGAKGISLSGGQKARVALARAVYSFTQHVLMDDPLAAVDSHTAKHLTDRCLNGPLLKGRTIILVSHHVELLLPSADYVVRILDGRIDCQGTPAELRASGELDGLVAMEEAEATKEDEANVEKKKEDGEVKVVEEESPSAKKERKKGPGKKLVQDEERAIGNVKWETYKLYIVAATYTTWAWTILVLIITQLLTVGERYWLDWWGEAYNTQLQATFAFARPAAWESLAQGYHHVDLHQHTLYSPSAASIVHNNATLAATTALISPVSRLPSANSHPMFYLLTYTAIVLLDVLFGVLSTGIGNWGQYRAAVKIHDRLLNAVMRSTIRFFNVTPVGRIINRFSRDVETIDTYLNSSLRTVIVYAASLIGAIVVVAYIVPWFLLPAAVISYLYWQYSVLYLRVGRSLRRLEAVSKSPIFSGFAEVLDGITTVRAFSVEARFFTQLCEQVDKTHQAFYYYWMMNRWLLLRFDVLGAFSVYFTTLLALSGAISAGTAGVAILSASSFVSSCYWISRFWGQLEMDFNSVERVQEYLNIPQEPAATIPANRPPAYWPSDKSGDHFLSVRDLEIKYAPDLPTVFKGSFEVKAGEKIGLIGRTGSGKSTLAMSFLRFAEPASGSIWLDGIDISTIGVDDLRSRITYIPQDAVLFSGTVRENLDPFTEHSDDELLDALARVNLGPRASSDEATPQPSRAPSSHRLAAIAAEEANRRPASLAGSKTSGGGSKSVITLATEVSAGGSNFSQGQRQLVAMARALLRQSNLIIMDEATASVDFATDEAIQAAIRSEFHSSTLLTIAHRLSSVIDYDRLLVLSDGKVAEFDSPINLLRKDGSLFKSLCEKSGKYRELFRAAEKKEKGDRST